MTIRFMLVCFACVASSCAPVIQPATSSQGVGVNATDEQSIRQVLDGFHEAAAQANEDRYFSYFADDAVFMGTDATERWTKSAFRIWAHPYFARGKAWSFRAIRRAIKLDRTGTVAWFDEDLATENLGAARGSGVLVSTNGNWLITHYNLTITVPNERFDLVKDVLSATLSQPPPHEPLARLAWLAGSWRATLSNGEITEETWTLPSGRTMLGVARSVRKDVTSNYEYSRIEARGDQVVFIARPKGQAETEFVLVTSDSKQATFENLAHDWPKRIHYERTTKGLEVRVDGAAGEVVQQWTYEPAVIGHSSH